MRVRPIVPALLVFALAMSACGARLSDEELATASASRTGQAAAGAGSGAGTGTGAATAGAGASTGASGGTAASAGTGATGGDAATAGGDAAAAGGECSPQPTQEVGVTDSEITLANIATISGPIQGFGQTSRNAVQAYINYVNSEGGVCGRTLRLATGDDRLDTGANRSETQRLAAEALGFVGGISVVDDGGAAILQGTNLPDVTLSIGSVRATLPNNFSPNPVPAQGNGTEAIMRYFVGKGITSAAIVNPAQADARARANGYKADMQAAGLANVAQFEVPITETNYVNVAQQIENQGLQLVITTLEVTGMAKLAQAFQQIGYRPQVPFYGAQAYGSQFIDLAGDAAEGTTLATTHVIFEDAPSVPAMANFLDWYQRTAPGSEPDFFSVMSWAATDMFVQAIRATNGAPTRDAVLAALATQTAYDAGGMLAPRNPPAKTTGNCFAIVTIEGGQWRRVEPASGFLNC